MLGIGVARDGVRMRKRHGTKRRAGTNNATRMYTETEIGTEKSSNK